MVNDEGGYSLLLHGDVHPETGGIAICGFSTVGMVGVIAASHIINSLDMKQLGTVLHKRFPAIALVHDKVPKHPVRVYQGGGVGVFTAEIQFPPEHDVMFAETVLEWFTEGGFDRLIIIDGLVDADLAHKTAGELYGVSSTAAGREALEALGIRQIQQGIVAGIAGYLLSEGDRRGIEVTALLAECNPMYPDARAAALTCEAVSDLTGIKIELSELLADARRIEENVREMFERAQSMLPAPADSDISSDPMIG